ncbi:MAG TPA: YlxR family protein [Bellilinea sp.]|nr:YlxR family protein [Bellilinea sp.]
MSKKPTKRVKHIPQRTCVGCRQVMPKRNLIRVVRSPEGVSVDLTGKAAGRGAYVHDTKSCWESALKGALAYALKTELTEQDRDVLIHYVDSLPVDVMTEA